MSSTKCSPESDSKNSDKDSGSKPKRKISSQPLDHGKSNLAFVPEESELDLENDGESKRNNYSAVSRHKSGKKCVDDSACDYNNGEINTKKCKDTITDKNPKDASENNTRNSRRHTTHAIELRRCSGRSDIFPVNHTITNSTRGSVNSVEIRRQNRPFKRFSRAWSQLSFHPLHQHEPVYELQGMETEVRKFIYIITLSFQPSFSETLKPICICFTSSFA